MTYRPIQSALGDRARLVLWLSVDHERESHLPVVSCDKVLIIDCELPILMRDYYYVAPVLC